MNKKKTTTAQKNAVLLTIKDKINNARAEIAKVNAIDLKNAEAAGIKGAFLDRLTLTDKHIDVMLAGVDDVVALPDYVGMIEDDYTVKSGLHIQKVHAPLGVVGIIYESRPNVTVDAAMLRQFAIMASLYLENVYGVEKPRTALLNVGKEEEKGDDVRREAYGLLRGTDCLNFRGNMESRDLLSGSYDVVVCDGFSGNVLIKATEGTALELLKKLKKDIYSRLIYKLGAALMKRMFMEEKEFMNYQNYGGSVLLGSSKVIVKGHGSSKAVAVAKCIEQAYRMETSGLAPKIEAELAKYEHYEQ